MKKYTGILWRHPEASTHPMLWVDWDLWRQMPKTSLQNAILLSVGLDPEFFEERLPRRLYAEECPDVEHATRKLIPYYEETCDNPDQQLLSALYTTVRAYSRNAKIARANLNAEPNGGGIYCAEVSAEDEIYTEVDLAQFATWAIQQDWDVPDNFLMLASDSASRPSVSRHKTYLLTCLSDAAREWWSTYDPDKKTTAPTNQQVTNWLMDERSVPKRVAEVMAQILRSEDIPPGPRK